MGQLNYVATLLKQMVHTTVAIFIHLIDIINLADNLNRCR